MVHYLLPGKVEVFGYLKGKSVCSHALFTPEMPEKLHLFPLQERTLKTGDQTMLNAVILDKDKHFCLRDTRMIHFHSEGDVEILATGNGNQMELMPFVSHSVPAWHGRASAVIQRTGTGSGRVIAEADGLQKAEWLLPSL